MYRISDLRTLITILIVVAALPAVAQDGQETGIQNNLKWRSPLVLVECAWLMLIGLGAPLFSTIKKGDESNLRGLNMPRGSIRGILALLVVGSFVNVLVLGGPALGDSFEIVVSAFGALTGSIIGFYFGSRNATPLQDNTKTSSQTPSSTDTGASAKTGTDPG